MNVWFLPGWPLEINNFVVFGVVLWAGLMGGALAHRTGILPRITGFIAIGFLLGPSGLGLLNAQMIAGAGVFVDIALGLIMFQLGEQVHIPSLRRDIPVLATGIIVSAATFALVVGVIVMAAGLARMAIGLADHRRPVPGIRSDAFGDRAGRHRHTGNPWPDRDRVRPEDRRGGEGVPGDRSLSDLQASALNWPQRMCDSKSDRLLGGVGAEQ
ncbi:MAG: cation:proton antiporter [Betaproteobacteria bacterium]|nr:cation:proton antiporter [Betaproteobacteria bacterium]